MLDFDNSEIAFRYKSDKELTQAKVLFSTMASPWLTSTGMKLTQLAIKLKLPVKGLIKSTIFKQFCGGESMEEAAQTAAILEKYNIGVILDYGVEGKEDEAEFDHAVPEFIKAIKYASSKKNIPFISLKVTGFCRFSLLEKLHAGEKLSDTENDEWLRVRQRIYDICGAAANYKVMVLIDAEESWIQKPIDDLADVMMASFNEDQPIVFNTFQMYRHDRFEFLKQSVDLSIKQGFILGAKIVRGAYMEKERARAAEKGYSSPIQPNKEATDKDYNEAIRYCMEHINTAALFVGTHNEHSCMLAATLLEEKGLPTNHFHVYFSQLFGMSDNISFNLAAKGYNVAKYLPYGPVEDVIPYLMRRAQENTSVKGQTGRELGLIDKEVRRRKKFPMS